MTAPVRINLQHAYEQNRQRIAQLWSEARPIASGDAADRYLQHQGITGTAPDTLRLHPALEYWHNDHSGRAACLGTFPALLAALQIDVHPHGLFKPAVRHTVALQRFYLTARGTPAPVPVFIKATGTDGHIKGAAVRLSVNTCRCVTSRGHRKCARAAASETAHTGMRSAAAKRNAETTPTATPSTTPSA